MAKKREFTKEEQKMREEWLNKKTIKALKKIGKLPILDDAFDRIIPKLPEDKVLPNVE